MKSDAPIRLRCASCQASLSATAGRIGEVVACPRCGKEVLIWPEGNQPERPSTPLRDSSVPASSGLADSGSVRLTELRDSVAEDTGFVLACEACGSRMRAKPELAGRLCRCPKCGAAVRAPSAGGDDIPLAEPMRDHQSGDTKYCHYCGKAVASIAEICPHCGVRQQDFSTYTGTSFPTPGPSRVAAALFAFLLGLVGAHKFYLGQVGMGVLYLVLNVCFFWTVVVPAVFAVICLIEGLVYLSYTDAAFARAYHRR